MLSRFKAMHKERQSSTGARLSALEQRLFRAKQAVRDCKSTDASLEMSFEQLKIKFELRTTDIRELQEGIETLSLQLRDFAHAKAKLTQVEEQLQAYSEYESLLSKLESRVLELFEKLKKLEDTSTILKKRDEELTSANREYAAFQEKERKSLESLATVIAQLPNQADLASLKAKLSSFEQKQAEHIKVLEQQFDLDHKALNERLQQLISDIERFKAKVVVNFKVITEKMSFRQPHHAANLFICSSNPQKEIGINLSVLNTLIGEINGILSYAKSFASTYATNDSHFASAAGFAHKRWYFGQYPQFFAAGYLKYLDVLQNIRQITSVNNPEEGVVEAVQYITMNAGSKTTGTSIQPFPELGIQSVLTSQDRHIQDSMLPHQIKALLGVPMMV